MGGSPLGPKARRECLAGVRDRYPAANRAKRSQLVSEVVANTGYHRKAVIRLLRRPERPTTTCRKGRPVRYGPRVAGALRVIWQAAGALLDYLRGSYQYRSISARNAGRLTTRPTARRGIVVR